MTNGISLLCTLSHPPKRVAKAVAPPSFRNCRRSSIRSPRSVVALPAVDRDLLLPVTLHAHPHAEFELLDGRPRLVHPRVAGEAGDPGVHHLFMREVDVVRDVDHLVPPDRLFPLPLI